MDKVMEKLNIYSYSGTIFEHVFDIQKINRINKMVKINKKRYT